MCRTLVCRTVAAATYAGEHRYADTTTAAAAGADNLQSGRWSVPIGSLIIVDDADQLPAAQLHWLTGNAAATNSKLLLITTSGAPQPRHTLTDVLAGQLPWAQQLGTPDPHHPQRGTAMQRTEHHLATTTGADTDQHTQARQLLARRDQLTDHYRSATQRSTHHDRDQHRDRDRDTGLEL
jgi:hypothetical protein